MPAISSRAPPTAATISRRRRRFSRASGSSAGSGGSAWRRSASRSFGGSVSRGLFSGSLSSRDGETRHASGRQADRKSTRLNSSHQIISYAVFCLKKKKKNENKQPQQH